MNIPSTVVTVVCIGVLTSITCPALGNPSAIDPSCFDDAGARHGVAPVLLQAIAMQESSMKPTAQNRNRDGSWDIGLMQINSRWFPTLARFGIQPEQLWDPCVNAHVGAWILSNNFQRLGINWEAVGAYNAKDPALRMRYAEAISRKVQQISIQHR